MSCCLGVQGKVRAGNAMNYFEEMNHVEVFMPVTYGEFAIWIYNLLN
jgi:hypothetical protein